MRIFLPKRVWKLSEPTCLLLRQPFLGDFSLLPIINLPRFFGKRENMDMLRTLKGSR